MSVKRHQLILAVALVMIGIVAALVVRREFGWHIHPAKLSLPEYLATMHELETAIRKEPGWERAVVCNPYRSEKELASFGINDDAVRYCWEVTNNVECVHVILLTNDGDVHAHGGLYLEDGPAGAGVVIERGGL
ncbi:MAG: hypothetical protein H6818_08940 [Phycisphaerales bacterium]|nr:hypothetical protein [Phycisphaerales bacterium]MCB9862695.1 hypothetical protein [Phycisphaerales bacterium]